jgi:hypothetical protein
MTFCLRMNEMIKENLSYFKIHEGNTTMFRVYSYVAFRRSVVKISKVRQQQNRDREIDKLCERERVNFTVNVK